MDVSDISRRALELELEGRYDKAIALVQDALRENDDPELRGELAAIYASRGLMRIEDPWMTGYEADEYLAENGLEPSDDAALADFTEAVKWEEVPPALSGMASILLRRGRIDEAESLINKALDRDPENAPALALLGHIKLAEGDPKTVVESMMRAIQSQSASPIAYKVYFEALAKMRRTEDAVKVIELGLQRFPWEERLLVLLGWFLADLSRFKMAGDVWRRAAEINRWNAEAWQGVAWAAAQAGNEEDMRHALDQAMELDPESTKTWSRREASRQPLLRRYET